MQVFTLEEIKENIRVFEGVALEVTLGQAVVFLSKYSDFYHYQKPLRGGAEVEDVKKRFDLFLTETSRPLCDVSPFELEQFGIYAITDPHKPATLVQRFTSETYEDIDLDLLPSDATSWFIVSKDYVIVDYYSRPLAS